MQPSDYPPKPELTPGRAVFDYLIEAHHWWNSLTPEQQNNYRSTHMNDKDQP